METNKVSPPSRAARLLTMPVIRIVIGILAVATPVILTLWLAHATLDKSMRVMWPQFLAAALCVWGYCLFVRKIERRPIAELSPNGAGRELALGALGAAALVVATIGFLLLTKNFQVTGIERWTVLVVPIAELVLVALVEELIFRGIVFAILERSLGSWIALGVTATLFALSHLPNEGVTVLAVAVTAMAGVMLGAAYMATGRLWLAIGIHFGWNYMLGTVFSVAVSGHAGKGLVQAALIGPDWVTGGGYGLEASFEGLVAISIASAFLVRRALRRGRIEQPWWKRKIAPEARLGDLAIRQQP